MKKFLIKCIVFLFFLVIGTEIYIRWNHLTIDIPRREIDEFGIQKYKPFQEGYWSNGTHKWQINKEGWAGELPKSFENMITLIGDSHIENFMNSVSCHLGFMLNKSNLEYNFLEAGRSGVTLIESFEIAKALTKQYAPKKHLIFAKNSDFNESIVEIKKMEDVTQVRLDDNEVINGKMKSPVLKLLLYNFKTLYYFRNNIGRTENKPKVEIDKDDLKKSESKTHDLEKNINNYKKLLGFISENYDTENIIVFLHPETEDIYLELLKEHNFNCVRFETKRNEIWGMSKNDLAHWSCDGFRQASIQIKNYLSQN